MADPKPQSHTPNSVNDSATPAAPQDYSSILIKVIEDVSKDPAALRKLVYALAWQNMKPETVASGPNIPEQAKSIPELERALELQRAIDKVEAYIASQPPKPKLKPEPKREPQPEAEPAPKPEPASGLKAAPEPELKPETDPEPASEPAWRLKAFEPDPDLEAFRAPPQNLDELAAAIGPPPKAEPRPAEQAPAEQPPPSDDQSYKAIPASKAVIMPPDRPPTWLYKLDRTAPGDVPDWLDHRIRIALETMEYGPGRRARRLRPGVASFLQLVGAVVFGVALYVGIAGWIHMSRQVAFTPMPPPALPAPPRSVVALPPNVPQFQFNPQLLPIRPAAEAKPSLPFPLPTAFGVYAASKGELIELEPLPIKIPDPRILVSAEIGKPSRATVSSEKLAFVIFRRDLLSNAPSTVSIRVIARVQRTMKFVSGKPITTEIEGTWRIRAKSYEFKVSPVEGQREMVMIQPETSFTFPAGRYALVLAGYGYDFSVAGKVTTPEQCLEQVEVLNGSVLSECPKV